jgi:hypothetical protein
MMWERSGCYSLRTDSIAHGFLFFEVLSPWALGFVLRVLAVAFFFSVWARRL